MEGYPVIVWSHRRIFHLLEVKWENILQQRDGQDCRHHELDPDTQISNLQSNGREVEMSSIYGVVWDSPDVYTTEIPVKYPSTKYAKVTNRAPTPEILLSYVFLWCVYFIQFKKITEPCLIIIIRSKQPTNLFIGWNIYGKYTLILTIWESTNFCRKKNPHF